MMLSLPFCCFFCCFCKAIVVLFSLSLSLSPISILLCSDTGLCCCPAVVLHSFCMVFVKAGVLMITTDAVATSTAAVAAAAELTTTTTITTTTTTTSSITNNNSRLGILTTWGASSSMQLRSRQLATRHRI